MKLEIDRQDDYDETRYKIAGREFIIQDLTLTRQKQLTYRVKDLLQKYEETGKGEHETIIDAAASFIDAVADECAELLSWLADLPEGERVDGAWFQNSFTNKRLLSFCNQLITDNELDGLADFVKKRLFPFLLAIAEMRAKTAMANAARLTDQQSAEPTSATIS